MAKNQSTLKIASELWIDINIGCKIQNWKIFEFVIWNNSAAYFTVVLVQSWEQDGINMVEQKTKLQPKELAKVKMMEF